MNTALKLSRALVLTASCLLCASLAAPSAHAQARPKPKPRPEIPHDKPIKKIEPIRMDKKKGGLDNVKPLKPDFDKAVRNPPDTKQNPGKPPEKITPPAPPPPKPPAPK